MNKDVLLPFLFLATILFFLSNCEQKKTELSWDKSLFRMGSHSSPRATDLNGDGVLDIVMGGGKAEMEEVDLGVFALDGQTGEILWQQKADAQMVGAAIFFDINEDGTDDVFIGGRKHNLMALDGLTGAVIWKYNYQYAEDPILKYARYNFYNGCFVPDQNANGSPELLIVNGGNWDAAPNSTEDRYPGVLMLLDTKDGAIVAADTMPDGKESYLSPICFSPEGNNDYDIIFGTGGETISGQLYRINLKKLVDQQLQEATVLASEEGHGFIAPPAIADLNKDGVLDISAISHAGTVHAINGVTNKPLWSIDFRGMESSNAPAIGHFNKDEIPDLFVTLTKGVWPRYTQALKVGLDGFTGQIIHQDSTGCFELSSAVVYDLNDDGYDEVIFSSNDYDCSEVFSADYPAPETIENRLIAYDFRQSSTQIIDASSDFKNIYSSPWIGDLDQDGYLDIVYCQYLETGRDFSQFLGMRIRRISSHIKIRTAPKWGEYMGKNGKGIFPL